MKKILIFATSILMFIGCGKERYSEINTDPGKISKPDILYLFLNAQDNILSNENISWFYSANRMILPFAQITTAGITSDEDNVTYNNNLMFEMNTNWGNVFLTSLYDKNFGVAIKELQNIIKTLPPGEAEAYSYVYNMAQIMFVQMAVYASDTNGDIVYLDALKALYTNPPLLKPKYDSQEEIFGLLDADLKKSIEVLSNPVLYNEKPITQVTNDMQDPVYQFNPEKWIKFANSVRLKIALRLLHANPSEAKKITSEVAKSGKYMSTNDDDYRFVARKYYYGPNGNIWAGKPTDSFIDLLKKNRDPRIRYFFSKNHYNPGVIQGMLDEGLTFPDYIAKEMVVDKGEFIRWKSADMNDGEEFMGEPWVRYQGIPVTQDAYLSDDVINSFATNKFEVVIDKDKNIKRVFMPFARVNEAIYHLNGNKFYPSVKSVQDEYKPGGKYNYTIVLNSSAETQLILALFAVQGVDVGGVTAEQLYKNAIECSVKAYDKNASHLNMMYYNDVYDKTTFKNLQGEDELIEKQIKLQDGELEEMFKYPANQLTGSLEEKIEKCFIQLIINSFQYPTDIYTYTKFGGVPKKGSTVWPRINFTNNDANLNIPRRFLIAEPNKADINYNNLIEALNRQGFSQFGSISPPMNQRYWNDKNSPAWGAGPIVR